MRCTTPNWLTLLTVMAGLGIGETLAQEQAGENQGEPKKEPFTIDQVIHPVVKALKKPEFRDGIVSMPMAISSDSEVAQRHVLQGMAYIQAAWDFEAYRHFCEAVTIDPECAMAYWGIGLALAAPNNEFASERNVAIDRMITLMDATVEVGEKEVPLVTPIEQDYCVALATLFAQRGGLAAEAFQRLADDYPNNLQAQCLAIYLQRDGYDDFGQPFFGQETAVEKMRKVLDNHPENVGVLTFWAMLHAEAPDAAGHLRENILPLVRKIARSVPDFPPYEHLLGHFEWRCGNHRLAEEALARARALYEAHMTSQGETFHECDGWLRCQLYLATAMHSRGKFEEAMAIAEGLAALEVDEKRVGSAGGNLILWEARTLPARLYASRGAAGDMDRAIASLPKKGDPQLFVEKTLSLFYLEGLRQYLNVRRLLEAGDAAAAHDWRQALDRTVEEMIAKRPHAVKSSSISEYVRAVSALEVYAAEARGRVAFAGGEDQHGIAKSWFMSAAERQQRPSLLMPPAVVSPMECVLAEYYRKTSDARKAAETYQEALRRRPNDLRALQGYREALLGLGHAEVAEEVSGLIKQVTAQ